MIKKIINLLMQLQKNELKEIFKYISNRYCVDLRNIKCKEN